MADKVFTVRELTKRGFIRRKDLDFNDDGNHFIGFEYDGMPITYLKADGEYYCSVRVDYIDDNFSAKQWMGTEEYELIDEFNGCKTIDADKLVENIKAIKAKVAELNAKAEEEASKVDVAFLKKVANDEADYAEQVVEEFKFDYDWFDADICKLSLYVSYAKNLERKISSIRLIDWEGMSRMEAYKKMNSYNENGYLFIKNSDYYIKELLKAIHD